jgi:NhaA family Na+:H+ antiporter
MAKIKIPKTPADRWVIDPMKRFISNSTTSGIVLFSSAALALILANSPWKEGYHHLWETIFTIGFGDFVVAKDLHHWINDGLMAVFFFVIGLELKREIVAGELSQPKNAVLPLLAAVGGMVVPALVYLLFNASGEPANGWGIPMATDIAFALGILYLFGDRVPMTLKIFLTALAIADDIGAVLVIALFYTSTIDVASLLTGIGFMAVLVLANFTGVRNTVFYGIIGIGGLWLAFLMSGVHATIAGVLAAFTIPANVKVTESYYSKILTDLLDRFKKAKPNELRTVTNEQFHILENIQKFSNNALTPLQRLEHKMHPLVAFVIMPIFALANAGVTLGSDFGEQLMSPVALGIIAGLLVGKLIGIMGVIWLTRRLGWADLPAGLTMTHMWGAAFLASIGFTMSLFITELAFTSGEYVMQAKIGVLVVSFFSSIVGYLVINRASKLQTLKTV